MSASVGFSRFPQPISALTLKDPQIDLAVICTADALPIYPRLEPALVLLVISLLGYVEQPARFELETNGLRC